MGRRRFTAAAASGDHGLLLGLGDDDHPHYFRADCTRAFAGDPIPDGVDTRSIGSAARELRNLYLGDAGRLYWGLAQDVDLGRLAASTLRFGQDQILSWVGSLITQQCLYTLVAGDTNPRLAVRADGRLTWGPGNAAVDTALFRGAASRLDLLSGNSFNLVLGDITLAATRLVDGVDPSMYSKGYLEWQGHAGAIFGVSTAYVGPDGVDATENHTQIPVPEAAVAVSLFIQVLSNTLSGASTVTLRRNGAGTAITLTIPGGATGVFSDVAHSVAFAAGDLASVQVVAGADGPNSLTIGGVTVKFAQSAA